MTIQECYQQFGGDFDEVKKRLSSEILIKKFIAKFLDDSSFHDLRIAMEEGSRERAFAAAHTLKGVCSNLSLNRLLFSASKLTELLRSQTEPIPEEADVLFDEVRRDYELTVSTILCLTDTPLIYCKNPLDFIGNQGDFCILLVNFLRFARQATKILLDFLYTF